MKKYIIYSDTHILAPHNTGHTVAGMIQDSVESDNRVILTGDIIDRENAKKSEVANGTRMMADLNSRFSDAYLYGNHEGRKPTSYYYKLDNILFLHGHTIFWNKEKVERWENKKLGQSKFKFYRYKLWKSFKKRKNKKLHPKEVHLTIMKNLMEKFGCHTIVFGHSHRNYDVTYDWGRVINVPQGKTILEI